MIDIKIMATYPNSLFMINHIMENCQILLDKLEEVRVDSLVLSHKNRWNRAFYFYPKRWVVMNPFAKCFQPDYRGYKYKEYGGKNDLSPGGVFAHECGHGATFKNRILIKEFKTLKLKESPTRYGATRTGEDIAESFRIYTSNPELLLDKWPQRFMILNKTMKFYE